MKRLMIAAVVVFALCSMAYGAQTLTVGGQDVESVTLKVGQLVAVVVSSDDASTYNAYVGFGYGAVGGSFLHVSTQAEAGTLASESPYTSSVDDFEGYFVTAAGGPAPGMHFVFYYTPDQVGQAELKFYNASFTLTDSVSVTVVAADMGTSFTYQGRLIDTDAAADGKYDFSFKIFDSPSSGGSIGLDVLKNDVDVIDGYFTVTLDFGSEVFAGDGVWLETSVRPGDSEDVYTTLSPRQTITPTPYATYAAASDWNNLVNIPADIADGDDNSDTDTVLTESQVESFITNDISSGYLPYKSGSKFANSGLYYDGSSLLFGTTSPVGAKITLLNEKENYGLYAESTKSTGNNYSVYGLSSGSTSGYNYGVLGKSSSPIGYNYGIAGVAVDSTSGSNIGVYGWGSNSGTGSSWAGYFEGQVLIRTNLNPSEDLRIANNAGAEVAIGTSIDFNSKLKVYSDSDVYGIYSQVQATTSGKTAILGIATGNSTTSSYGVNAGSSSATSSNYAVYGHATTASTGTNYGIYGSGANSGSGDSYAGFFAGDVRVLGKLNHNYDLSIAADDGAEVGIGISPSSSIKLYTYSDSNTYSVYANNAKTSGSRYAFYATTTGNTTSDSVGVSGNSSSATGRNFGVSGAATTPSSGTNYGVYGYASNSGTGAAYAGYFFGNVHVNGSITYSGSISDTSDIRLKENIVPLENAGEKISALKAIYFNNKGESPNNREVGVIAQDVEKVLPELVSLNKDGYMAVDYTKLAPVLIEAVKDLMAENKQLKQRLDAMEEKLSDK